MSMPSWVPEDLRPTDRQRDMWGQLTFFDDGATADGWWLGWCPLHDTARDPQQASAQFNFKKDVYRCTAEEPCHAPKRAMSLTNLKARVDARNSAPKARRDA